MLFRPDLKTRRRLLLGCGSYRRVHAEHLWGPILQFPAGLYPFGREPVPA